MHTYGPHDECVVCVYKNSVRGSTRCSAPVETLPAHCFTVRSCWSVHAPARLSLLPTRPVKVRAGSCTLLSFQAPRIAGRGTTLAEQIRHVLDALQGARQMRRALYDRLYTTHPRRRRGAAPARYIARAALYLVQRPCASSKTCTTSRTTRQGAAPAGLKPF